MPTTRKPVVLPPDSSLVEVEARLTTELVIRLYARDEDEAKRIVLHDHLWLGQTEESQRVTRCVMWGLTDIEVGEVI